VEVVRHRGFVTEFVRRVAYVQSHLVSSYGFGCLHDARTRIAGAVYVLDALQDAIAIL
jgi:hypothetical protein